MKSFHKMGLAAAPLLVLGSSFVHPYGQIRQERSSGALLVEAEAPPKSLASSSALVRIATRNERNGRGTATWLPCPR
jgi:hypothetical protein